MSLLTDEELAKAAYPALEGVPSHWLVGRNRRVADASQAKTLKAVAEWLSEYCNEPEHARQGKYRGLCVSCVSVLFTALNEGKMPGEEKWMRT